LQKKSIAIAPSRPEERDSLLNHQPT